MYWVLNLPTRSGVARRELRERAGALLQARMWGVDADEPHGAELASGDLALIYVGPPGRVFVGRATAASTVRDWTPQEASVYPGEARVGVLLADVEEWDPPVSMDTIVERIDPERENPDVQTNARNGFRNGVVLITQNEYEAVLAARAEQIAQSPSALRGR